MASMVAGDSFPLNIECLCIWLPTTILPCGILLPVGKLAIDEFDMASDVSSLISLTTSLTPGDFFEYGAFDLLDFDVFGIPITVALFFFSSVAFLSSNLVFLLIASSNSLLYTGILVDPALECVIWLSSCG
jgi:hypothetical protein